MTEYIRLFIKGINESITNAKNAILKPGEKNFRWSKPQFQYAG